MIEGHEERVCPTGIAFLLTCSLSFISLLSFSQMHTLLLLHREESKSKAQRGGHTATFLSLLCWLGWTLPLRGWWGEMALWRNQPGASSCHHHMNPGLLNLQLWPPTWMGNDLSALVWHSLCLQQNHSFSVYNTSLLNPVSMGRWVLL